MRPDSALAVLAADHTRLAGTAHVGVLVPWANMIVESELPRLGLERVVFHYSRLVPARRYRALDEFLCELAAAVPAALGELARLSLAGTLLACTSVGFAFPAPYANATVVSAFDAILSALRRLGTDRIVLVTPYPVAWTVREVDALAARGVIVLGHASLGLDLLDDYTAVLPGQVNELVDQVGPEALARAQALVLSCTAWPTRHVIGDLESTLGIPVVSSNLALGLQAVQIALAGQPA
ncbi:MAG: hypothetical protein ACRDYA_00055 [Egibacteraceae bacterium]